MMLLVSAPDTVKNRHSFLNGRLPDADGLEPAFECCIFLKMLSIIVGGGCPYALQLPACKGGL